jgi:hypothetical protein
MTKAEQIYLVRVITDDRQHKLWAAATPRDEAVNEVLNVVPEGWVAALYHDALTDLEARALDLQPGEVREITSRTN